MIDNNKFHIPLNDYLTEYIFELYFRIVKDDFSNIALQDVATITMGQSPSGSSYNEKNIGTTFYQGRAEFGNFFSKRRLYTSEPKRLAKKGNILMSVRAPVGDLNFAYEDCCIGRGLASIASEYNMLIYAALIHKKKHLDSFNQAGTVFGSINAKSLKEFTIKIPNEHWMNKFNKLANNVFQYLYSNETETRKLEQARDSLLPKLMSGEIDVSKVKLDRSCNLKL